MLGMGTIINTLAIIIGGLAGLGFGKLLSEEFQTSLKTTCGVSVLFIGIAGAMEGMLKVTKDGLTTQKSMLVVGCLVLGVVVGEIINFEDLFERFGKWLKLKSGSAKDKNFVDSFVTASFTVCIGAMAIMGAINDGIYGDCSILVTKSILDAIILMVMAGSMGKGCIFSAIPVAVLQGSFTLLARVIQPIMTPDALANLSIVGSVLIFCVGVNLVWGKKVRVANLLPSIIFAVVAAFFNI